MGGRRFTYEEVVRYFHDRGCELISGTYQKAHDLLEYRCSCGNTATIRFKDFKYGKRCSACCRQRALETNRKNHEGVLSQQTGEFKERRRQTWLKKYGTESPLQHDDIKKKRQDTCMKRYGVNSVSQVPEIAKRQREGFYAKYSVYHFMHNPESKRRFHQTLFANHGVTSLAHLSRCASKESQKLFWAVLGQLPVDFLEKSYFAELNHEFVATNNGETFKYDFVQSKIKVVIEYNGRNFHPRANQLDDEVNWRAFHPKQTVKEVRAYEKRKYTTLENRGFVFLTVWDEEFHTCFNSLVEKCVVFLLSQKLS